MLTMNAASIPKARGHARPDVIAIGCSTGGPQALQTVLAGLSRRVQQPIVITQHMPRTFTNLLAEQISARAGLVATEARDGMPLQAGCVYLAPGGHHLLFQRQGNQILCQLGGGPPENFCKPAVDPMLRSLVNILGRNVLAVILTGMGHDGLAGCRLLAKSGGLVIAQDEATSVVWGMPGAVAAAGICHAILPLDQIAASIVSLAGGVK